MRHVRSFITGIFYEDGSFHPQALLNIYANETAPDVSIDCFRCDFGYSVIPLKEALELLEKQAREELSKSIQDEEILKYAIEAWLENLLEDLPTYGFIVKT